MASNVPYRGLPTDKNNNVMQEYNVLGSVLATTSGTTAASSLITLNDNTTVLRVTVVGTFGNYAALRWIGSTNTNPSVVVTAGSSNFDYAIPAGWVSPLAVPQDPGQLGTNSIVGINRQAGLFNKLAVITVGPASVMISEF